MAVSIVRLATLVLVGGVVPIALAADEQKVPPPPRANKIRVLIITGGHDVDLPVKIADPRHPITRFMKDYEILDETYKNVEILPTVKPLLTTGHPKSDKVIAWTHTYGNSAVVYIQSGHGPTAYNNPNFRRLVAQAIRWATGRLPDPSEEGFVPLFNGKNLDGWIEYRNVRIKEIKGPEPRVLGPR